MPHPCPRRPQEAPGRRPHPFASVAILAQAQHSASGTESIRSLCARQPMAFGGDSGQPASGGTPGPAVGGLDIPEWSPAWALDDVALFRNATGWRALMDWLKANIVTHPRRLLAVHTTSACHPKESDGPSGGSLKECGMGNILQSAVGDTWFVRVELPHAFSSGDGLGVQYVSDPLESQKQVENHACLELLCYLVASAPGRVRLPPGAFLGGQPTVDNFKERAIALAREVGFRRQSLGWQIPEWHLNSHWRRKKGSETRCRCCHQLLAAAATRRPLAATSTTRLCC